MNLVRALVVALGLGASLVVGALVAAVLYFKHYRIPQDGMYPTMPSGTIVIAERKPYGDISEVVRGDVVVWRMEREGRHYNMVWRVVGLPGDSLLFTETRVLLNGQALKHRALGDDGPRMRFREELSGTEYDVAYDEKATRSDELFRVPPGHVFVVGDNRDHAYDSRETGAVPLEAIVGKVVWWTGL